jgi:heptosyltransferase-1
MNGRFLIIRLSALGDIIHTLPAFAALRRNCPKARLVWVVGKEGKEVLDFVPGIDEVVVVGDQGWRGKIKDKNQTAFDFQGLVKSSFMALFSRARTRIGFNRKNLKEPLAAHFYTDRLEEVPESMHVIAKNLKLLTKVGVKEDRFEFPLNIPEEVLDSVRQKIPELGRSGDKRLVIFNVGASWETKRWPAEAWARLWEMVRQEKLSPLFLWGNEEEKRAALAASEKSRIPLVPFLSIKEVMALIKQAALLVSGDTFALHAACALGVPVVGLFGPTNPARNGPFRPQDRVAFHQLDCGFCYKRECSSMECLKKITPEEVAGLISERLGENG